jgi:hypothetical protein
MQSKIIEFKEEKEYSYVNRESFSHFDSSCLLIKKTAIILNKLFSSVFNDEVNIVSYCSRFIQSKNEIHLFNFGIVVFLSSLIHFPNRLSF